jgi:hypothetical protein
MEKFKLLIDLHQPAGRQGTVGGEETAVVRDLTAFGSDSQACGCHHNDL